MKCRRIMMVCVTALACVVTRASAQLEPEANDGGFAPLLFSLITPTQVPPEDWEIRGLGINLIYGRSQAFYGFEAGLVNHVKGGMKGLQAGGIANIIDGPSMSVQLGLVNTVRGTLSGLQVGAVNYAYRASLAQFGVFNGAEHVDGLQLGLINVTQTMFGAQLGLVNVIQDNDIPFIPVFNFYF